VGATRLEKKYEATAAGNRRGVLGLDQSILAKKKGLKRGKEKKKEGQRLIRQTRSDAAMRTAKVATGKKEYLGGGIEKVVKELDLALGLTGGGSYNLVMVEGVLDCAITGILSKKNVRARRHLLAVRAREKNLVRRLQKRQVLNKSIGKRGCSINPKQGVKKSWCKTVLTDIVTKALRGKGGSFLTIKSHWGEKSVGKT